jgi:HAMP domain-containing protein
MRIETRLIATTALSFAVAALIAGYLSYQLEIRQAQAEINAKAKVLIDAAAAVRGYTSEHITPLLEGNSDPHFLPQQVPAFAAQTTMLNLRERYPQFQYREVSANPTNTNDRASDWEAGILRQLRADRNLQELVGEHGSGSAARFFVARPLRLASTECLRCHSVPEAAPRAMIAKYGAANGFGWALGDVVALQIVDVPTSPSRQKAFNSVYITVGSIVATFALIEVLIIFMIRRQITRPLLVLSDTARALSLGKPPPSPETSMPTEFDEVRAGLARLSNSVAVARELTEHREAASDKAPS